MTKSILSRAIGLNPRLVPYLLVQDLPLIVDGLILDSG